MNPSLENKPAEPQIHPSWKRWLSPEFEKPYMQSLKAFLKTEYGRGKVIFPKGSEYFSALNATPLDQVKVVIIGQDPYHGPKQAHGLCFSVQKGVALPPSLQNIFQELKDDIGVTIPNHGYLMGWADQGVLLLNSVLTVEQGKAGAHQKKGWEEFTDRIVHVLNEHREGIVYLLWGSYAQKKAQFVDRKKNLVIEGPHPSPLSAYRGFFGSKPFSKINDYLKKTGQTPIDWSRLD